MTIPMGRLGRGLGSLIPGADDAPARSGVVEASLDQITRNPYQPRHAFDPAALDELAQSIRTHGLIQPLIVTRQGNGYQLIAGERRWQAARLAGLRTVPVIVKEATDQARLELALVENVQRADLNVLEEAEAYRQLHEDFSLTHEQIAQRVGKGRVAVTNTIRLLKLEPALREAIAEGRLSANHGRALLALPPDLQLLALKVVEQRGLTARQTEALARALLEQGADAVKAAPKPRPVSADTAQLQDQFRRALNTKVDLVRGKKGGKITIHFYSDEELQTLYDRLIDEEEG